MMLFVGTEDMGNREAIVEIDKQLLNREIITRGIVQLRTGNVQVMAVNFSQELKHMN